MRDRTSRITASPPHLELLWQRYQRVRATSERLCEPLQAEDYVIQSMPDVSPPKWHLTHVTWFFEAFVLQPFLPGYHPLNERYDHLFNSYYKTHGTPFERARRVLFPRPTLSEAYVYRSHVDQTMERLLTQRGSDLENEVFQRIGLGLEHEQQHKGLLLMDIKHILAQNPLRPVYRHDLKSGGPTANELRWIQFPAGLRYASQTIGQTIVNNRGQTTITSG